MKNVEIRHCVNRNFGYQTTGMRSIPEQSIKRGVAKLLEKFIKDNAYGFAIRGHRIKRGVAL